MRRATSTSAGIDDGDGAAVASRCGAQLRPFLAGERDLLREMLRERLRSFRPPRSAERERERRSRLRDQGLGRGVPQPCSAAQCCAEVALMAELCCQGLLPSRAGSVRGWVRLS